MHEETYYGIKEIGKDEDKKIYKTLRTPIEKVKRKDLDNIPDRLGGSKDVYESLVEWFGDYEVGEEVLKANGNKYPVSKSDKEHKEIIHYISAAICSISVVYIVIMNSPWILLITILPLFYAVIRRHRMIGDNLHEKLESIRFNWWGEQALISSAFLASMI